MILTDTRVRCRGGARSALASMLAAGALLLGSAAHAASLLVDDFSAPDPAVTSVLTGLGEDMFNVFTDTVPGGLRTVYHHNYVNPLNSVSALSVGNGVLSSSSGVGTRTEVAVFYGAFARTSFDPPVAGPRLGLDLTPFDTFRLDFSGTSTVVNINIVLYTANPLDPDDPRYYSTVGQSFAPSAPGAPMLVDLPFRLSDPFNFAQVDGIALIINRANSATGVSWNLDSFGLVSVIPEPTPAAMLLAGLAVLGWAARRRPTRAG